MKVYVLEKDDCAIAAYRSLETAMAKRPGNWQRYESIPESPTVWYNEDAPDGEATIVEFTLED